MKHLLGPCDSEAIEPLLELMGDESSTGNHAACK